MNAPFAHDPEDLPAKRFFVDLARKYYDNSYIGNDEEQRVAYLLASTLLYMNHADYLAQWFAYSIQRISNDAVSTYYYKQISVKTKDTKDINIGKAIKIIENYNFSGKTEVLKILKDVDNTRNTVAHTMMKVKTQRLKEMNHAMNSLKDNVEQLIQFTDEFRQGMPPKNMLG